MPPTAATIQLDDLFSIQQLAEKFPNVLSEQTLRWQLRHRKENGLNAACVPVGKKLLISKSRYESWLAARAAEVAA